MSRPEFLFAHWAVRSLKNARGLKWRNLVDQVASLPETDPDSLAFQLMMVRLNGCASCDARKYSEVGGCARCSQTTLGFSKETEAALLARYRTARREISEALSPDKRASIPIA